MTASQEGIYKFLQKFSKSGCLLRRPGSGRPSKVTAYIKAIVERQIRQGDETTAYQLHGILTAMSYKLSLLGVGFLWVKRSVAVLTASLYVKKTKKEDFTRPFNTKTTTLRMSCMYIPMSALLS